MLPSALIPAGEGWLTKGFKHGAGRSKGFVKIVRVIPE